MVVILQHFNDTSTQGTEQAEYQTDSIYLQGQYGAQYGYQ